MIEVKDIQEAKQRIQGVAMETPLIPYAGDDSGRELWFKPENLQPIGAFKIRGAFNRISALSDKERAKGIIAHSSGNHAQAVAWSARRLGIKATIIMPEVAPPIKIRNTRSFGAEVVLVKDGAEVAMRALMNEMSAEHGYVEIPPFDDNMIIAGQGTVGLEILQQCPNVGTVIVPVGGGGLIGGTSTWLKSKNPGIRIVGVEPALANDTQLSFTSGAIQSIPKEQAKSTIADGLRVTRPGELTCPLVQAHVDDIITVEEQQIIESTRKIITETRLMVEPSGAVGFAAWLEHPALADCPEPAVCVISGGNIDPSLLGTLLDERET